MVDIAAIVSGRITSTVGVSWDRFHNQTDQSRTQLNPKLGVTWTPLAGTSVRGSMGLHGEAVGRGPVGAVRPASEEIVTWRRRHTG